MAPSSKLAGDIDTQEGDDGAEQTAQGETLAEGIEKDQDSTLPDYYNPLSAIPDMEDRWKWTTDSEGFVVPQTEEWMRMYPKEQFKSSTSNLNKKMETNMRQMQETRKVCAKIGIVKQMQIQAQVSDQHLRITYCRLTLSRHTKTSSRGTNHSHSSNKTLVLWSFLTMAQSWLLGSAAPHSSAQLARYSIMLVSRTSSLPL
jgi:hypothetical protein